MTAIPLIQSPARQRLTRVGRTLLLLIGASALVLGAAIVISSLLVAALLRGAGAGGIAEWIVGTGWIAGLLVMGRMLWMARFTRSLERTALWVEERAPELRYALVTIADPLYRPLSVDDPLERIAGGADTSGMLRQAAWRSLARYLALLLLLSIALLLLPAGWRTPTTATTLGNGTAVARPIGNRLLDLRVDVVPPDYTGRDAFRLDDPSTITALSGSDVTITGDQSAEGVSGQLDGDTVRAITHNNGWALHFRMPDSAGPLTLIDREFRRVIVIDARADQIPVVRLRLPSNDTTLRTVSGTLRLGADLSDDIGLARGEFEFIVSSGETEGNFTFRSGTIGVTRFSARTAGRLETTVPYSYFELKEGDQLSIRAVGIDGNTLTGPGKGFSETRIIRVARSSEYDSLAVTPAPPAIDTAAMSLRMLIIATEKLDRDRPRLKRDGFIAEALRLAKKAETIRDKIKAIMDDQSMGGEFDIDPRFMLIYNDMWEGVRALSVAEPRAALPPLRSAYATLKQLQDAIRYYIRGQTAPPLVNVARVRMSGTDTVEASKRGARSLVPLPLQGYASRYTAALEQLSGHRSQALQELTLIQGDALRDARPAAEAIGRLVEALGQRDSAPREMEIVRRAMEGKPRVTDSLSIWGSAW